MDANPHTIFETKRIPLNFSIPIGLETKRTQPFTYCSGQRDPTLALPIVFRNYQLCDPGYHSLGKSNRPDVQPNRESSTDKGKTTQRLNVQSGKRIF